MRAQSPAMSPRLSTDIAASNTSRSRSTSPQANADTHMNQTQVRTLLSTRCHPRRQDQSKARCLLSCQLSLPQTLILELDVLVGGKWAHPDVGDGVLGNARADAHQRTQVHYRRVHHAIDGQLLDLVQQRLALLGIALVRLLFEELVDVRIAA